MGGKDVCAGGRGKCVGLMGFVAHVAFMSFAFNLIAFLWVRHKIRQQQRQREREREEKEEASGKEREREQKRAGNKSTSGSNKAQHQHLLFINY